MVLGEHFTYSGYHDSKVEQVYFMGRWRTISWRYVCWGIYDFTLSGIDGTIEFYQRGITYYNLFGEVIEKTSYMNGYGTDALAGVTVKAREAPAIYTVQTGTQWATLEGTIWGWAQT